MDRNGIFLVENAQKTPRRHRFAVNTIIKSDFRKNSMGDGVNPSTKNTHSNESCHIPKVNLRQEQTQSL